MTCEVWSLHLAQKVLYNSCAVHCVGLENHMLLGWLCGPFTCEVHAALERPLEAAPGAGRGALSPTRVLRNLSSIPPEENLCREGKKNIHGQRNMHVRAHNESETVRRGMRAK